MDVVELSQDPPGGARSGGSLRRSLLRLPEKSSPLDRNDTSRIDATHVSADELPLLDGLGRHHHQLGCLARREGPFSPAIRQALPLEEAHRQIAPAIVLTDLVDRTMPERSSFAAASASVWNRLTPLTIRYTLDGSFSQKCRTSPVAAMQSNVSN
jgi:hypothetical protein